VTTLDRLPWLGHGVEVPIAGRPGQWPTPSVPLH